MCLDYSGRPWPKGTHTLLCKRKGERDLTPGGKEATGRWAERFEAAGF